MSSPFQEFLILLVIRNDMRSHSCASLCRVFKSQIRLTIIGLFSALSNFIISLQFLKLYFLDEISCHLVSSSPSSSSYYCFRRIFTSQWRSSNFIFRRHLTSFFLFSSAWVAWHRTTNSSPFNVSVIFTINSSWLCLINWNNFHCWKLFGKSWVERVVTFVLDNESDDVRRPLNSTAAQECSACNTASDSTWTRWLEKLQLTTNCFACDIFSIFLLNWLFDGRNYKTSQVARTKFLNFSSQTFPTVAFRSFVLSLTYNFVQFTTIKFKFVTFLLIWFTSLLLCPFWGNYCFE